MYPHTQANNRHRWRCSWRFPSFHLDWRWGSYLIASFLSLLILAVGGIAQKSGDTSIEFRIASLYLSWIVSMVIFIGSNYDTANPAFFMRGLFNLLCGATTLSFISSIGQITSDQLHLWIPISTTCGIFMAVALTTAVTCLGRDMRRGILNVLGAAPEDLDLGYGPLLPTTAMPPIILLNPNPAITHPIDMQAIAYNDTVVECT